MVWNFWWLLMLPDMVERNRCVSKVLAGPCLLLCPLQGLPHLLTPAGLPVSLPGKEAGCRALERRDCLQAAARRPTVTKGRSDWSVTAPHTPVSPPKVRMVLLEPERPSFLFLSATQEETQ